MLLYRIHLNAIFCVILQAVFAADVRFARAGRKRRPPIIDWMCLHQPRHSHRTPQPHPQDTPNTKLCGSSLVSHLVVEVVLQLDQHFGGADVDVAVQEIAPQLQLSVLLPPPPPQATNSKEEDTSQRPRKAERFSPKKSHTHTHTVHTYMHTCVSSHTRALL